MTFLYQAGVGPLAFLWRGAAMWPQDRDGRTPPRTAHRQAGRCDMIELKITLMIGLMAALLFGMRIVAPRGN